MEVPLLQLNQSSTSHTPIESPAPNQSIINKSRSQQSTIQTPPFQQRSRHIKLRYVLFSFFRDYSFPMLRDRSVQHCRRHEGLSGHEACETVGSATVYLS